MDPHPAVTIGLLHLRDRAPGGALRTGKAHRDELVVGDIGTDLAVGTLDQLLDLG